MHICLCKDNTIKILEYNINFLVLTIIIIIILHIPIACQNCQSNFEKRVFVSPRGRRAMMDSGSVIWKMLNEKPSQPNENPFMSNEKSLLKKERPFLMNENEASDFRIRREAVERHVSHILNWFFKLTELML